MSSEKNVNSPQRAGRCQGDGALATRVLPVSAAAVEQAAALLRAGETVAFPTETVYGLGADAASGPAVAKIFAAKGRPADNPLIVHIAAMEEMDALVRSLDRRVPALGRAFWPGPLTLVLEKSPAVPDIVSAGLATVAVRMPAHPAALALIRRLGRPVAAPSANASGRPSPTEAAHVLADLSGKIPLILDGGPCGVGVESTVLDLTGGRPRILRPGGVTAEALGELLPDLAVDRAALEPLADGREARSPGMRHRHYAPKARVLVFRGEKEAVARALRSRYDEAESQGLKAVILCSSSLTGAFPGRRARALGPDAVAMAANLYAALRSLDAEGAKLILAEATATDGLGLAFMNRLLRAADFDVEDV